MTKEELQHRIKNALVIIDGGHSFNVGELTFGCKDDNHFYVAGSTTKHDLNNITKESAIKEINEIKTLFKKMILASPELSEFIKGRQVEYHLDYDYGMGALGICFERNGQIIWELR